MAEKTKQQKANERAEILENMEDAERELYRSRKTYVSILHQWKDFFQDSDGDEVKELLLAIIDYDATGEEPVFKNKLNQRVFNGFIKNHWIRILMIGVSRALTVGTMVKKARKPKQSFERLRNYSRRSIMLMFMPESRLLYS